MQLHAQSKDRPIWLSVDIGHQEYRGDLGNEFFNYAFGTNWVLGYRGSLYLSPFLDLGLNLSIGELDIQNGLIPGNPDLSETAFSKTYVNTSLSGRIKFANGSILPANSFVQPYLSAGIGLTAFGGGDENLKNGITFTLPATFGLDIPVNETVKLYVQSTYNRTFADGFDGSDRLDNRSHDDYMVYSAGVKIAISASKRESRQGISDPDFNGPVLSLTAVKAEETNKPKEVPESEEKKRSGEETTEQPAMNGNGSGNEIKESEPSAEDKSEETNETDKKSEQIPMDSDGDRINDETDSCPKTPGVNYLSGCPARDGDADRVTDDRDACPEEPGAATMNGCPAEKEETEAAIEKRTASEEEKGVVRKDSIQGVSEALRKRIDVIYNNLQYEAGEALIRESSKDDLDELAQIMKDNPKLQLIIEGYTDSKGEASYNLLLSKDRADAVKQYLMGRGIDEIRLRAEGYGEISPVATNNTKVGRAKNRRVELRLTYHWIL